MKTEISVQAPGAQLARLSGAHGYRFEGDTVRMNAMFALLNNAAHECSWALQLWACPSAPASALAIKGHLVAEAALPPIGELADETEHFEVAAAALPPAGAGEHTMVLALVSGRPGQFTETHDFCVYANRERFAQPRLCGNVGYQVNGGRAQLFVGAVENPRPTNNRSGTLSLELWALPAAYAGGRFAGHHLAGVAIGRVQGQSRWSQPLIETPFAAPPAGEWHIVLMLREWTANGYVTRDYTNFATRYVVAPAAQPAAAKAIAPAAKAAEPAVKPAAPVAKATEPAVKTTEPTKAAAVAKAAKGVSVNSAPVEELAAVEGLNKKLAEGIVKKRPFASLDDLRQVKGLGEKILGKIRSSLRL